MVESGPDVDIKPGNALPLASMPIGTMVHNVELKPGQGAQDGAIRGRLSHSWSARTARWRCCACRAARCAASPTSAARPSASSATSTHENESGGKAGRSRWKGKRPNVRGIVMNPVDHPHGGGEGKTKGSHPVTPWGKPTLGFRTRNKKKSSSKLIVRSRKRGKGSR